VSKPGDFGIESALSWLRWRPAYWRTLRNLRSDRSSITADGSTLRFEQYAFEPATVFPNGAIEANQIAEVNLDLMQLRLTSSEVLFVTHPSKAALLTFVNSNDLKVERRISVWGALLDPFLDTWEDQATIDRQFSWFAGLGLNREAVDRWRREVALAMYAYNFGTMLWEWGSLDFSDVLTAQQARLRRPAFNDFYWRAMQVAALDPLQTHSFEGHAYTADGALYDVLLEWYPKDLTGSSKDFTEKWNARTEKLNELRKKLLAELTAAYSEPHRRYHTFQHIEFCLREIGKHRAHAVRPSEIRWALLFHDAIYDPRRNDNEARSADWACRVMQEMQRSDEEIVRVRKLILATAHAGNAETPDEALLLDIDLSILGADDATFDEYDRAIRVEYEWVPDEAYRSARANVLQGFLKRDRIFRTVAYRQQEAAARRNIERALERLR
jgi:predicted metal-dependent HD superfamily phosphohydrolase